VCKFVMQTFHNCSEVLQLSNQECTKSLHIHWQFQGGYPTHDRGYCHVRHGSTLSLCVLLKLLWFQSRREKPAKARNNSYALSAFDCCFLRDRLFFMGYGGLEGFGGV